MQVNDLYNGPCGRDCTGRSAVCHLTCKKYLEFTKENLKARVAKRMYYSTSVTDGMMKRHEKWLKYKLRR